MKKAALGLHVLSGVIRIGGGVLAVGALVLAATGLMVKKSKKDKIIKRREKKEE